MKRTRYQIKNKRGEIIFYLIVISHPAYNDVFSVSLTYDNNVLVINDIVDSIYDLKTIYCQLLENTNDDNLIKFINSPVIIEELFHK